MTEREGPRTGKLWAAWAPDKLDPWSPPEAGEEAAGVAPSFWLTHHLLPLRLERRAERQVLVVAAEAADVDPQVLLELRRLVLMPVRIVPAAADDVAFWLDVLYRGRNWLDAVRTSLTQTLEFSGRLVTGAGWSAGNHVSVSDVAALFALTEDVALEALALRARLPYVRLARYALSGSYASQLLSRELARRHQALPFLVRRGTVVLASPRVYDASERAEIAQELGLPPRFCLCSQTAFDEVFARLYEPESPAARLPAQPDVLAQLGSGGLISRSHLDGLMTLARATGEPPLAAALRLGYVDQQTVSRANAELLGLLFAADAELAVDADLAAYGSPTLWLRWHCIPIRLPGQGPTLASVTPLRESLRQAANRLAGVNFQVVLVTQAGLASVLSSAPMWRSSEFLPEHHLLETGLVRATTEELGAASRLSQAEGISLADAFLRIDAIELEDLVEAKAVASACPWLHLDRYAPQSEVPELIPEFWASAEHVLAFRRRGATVTVALLNGQDELPAGLEALTGLAVEPVLGLTEGEEQAYQRWYQTSSTLPDSYRDFAAFLVRQGVLTSHQFDEACSAVSRFGTALDTGLARFIPVAEMLSRFCGLDLRDLELIPERREYIDPLGQVRVELLQRDPVEHDIAQLLSRDMSTQLCALPLGAHGTGILVAAANPLSPGLREDLEQALQRPVVLQVAARQQIERAHGRVWNTASLGERLVLAGLVTPDELTRGLKVCEATGVRLGEALLSLSLVSPTELAFFLSKQAGVPFFDLSATVPDPEVTALMPPPTGGRASYLPLYREANGTIVLGAPEPLTAQEMNEARSQLAVEQARQVVVTAPAFDETLDGVFRGEFHAFSASALMTRSPEQSARWVLNRGQRVSIIAAIVLVLGGLVMDPAVTGVSLMLLTTTFYLSFSVYKFYLAYSALAHTLEIETTEEEVNALDERFLPVYTILVPLYRETAVLPQLVRAIARLDYPKPKLDVKLLLEEDDQETILAARQADLPSHFHIVIVPSGLPKGKPKACNYGLIYARGEFVVIYDAEDLPERDQLKKAIVAFAKADERVACIQAKLNYFNRDQNLLTRWFTTEYSMWFDLFLPGLDASHAPIPLGGTSNHFRAGKLRELGAWDPFNVTEDADLGMRLFKVGWKTAVIDSTTYEEANSEMYNWIRQRSRWVKGYIQTYLVHMRRPVALLRQLGIKDFFSFQMVVGGTFFGFLVNPLFWMLTAGWFLFEWPWIKLIFPAGLFYLGAFNLYLGNFAFTYLNVAGCLKRGYYDLVKYALMTPIYWALMSVAAWKGFLQLFYAPSYWEKTNHGLYQGEMPDAVQVGDPTA